MQVSSASCCASVGFEVNLLVWRLGCLWLSLSQYTFFVRFIVSLHWSRIVVEKFDPDGRRCWSEGSVVCFAWRLCFGRRRKPRVCETHFSSFLRFEFDFNSISGPFVPHSHRPQWETSLKRALWWDPIELHMSSLRSICFMTRPHSSSTLDRSLVL